MIWNTDDHFQVTCNKVIFALSMSLDFGTFIMPLIYRPVILDADGRRRIYGESVNFGDKMPGNLNRKSSGRLDPAGKNPNFLCSPRTRPWCGEGWGINLKGQVKVIWHWHCEGKGRRVMSSKSLEEAQIRHSWPWLTDTRWASWALHSIQQLFALLGKRKVGIVGSVKSCCLLKTSLS